MLIGENIKCVALVAGEGPSTTFWGVMPMAARRLSDLDLTEAERTAILETNRRLKDSFPVSRLIIFGSAARGERTEQSDLDLLVLTVDPVARAVKHAMYHIVFEVNLKYDTNLSLLCLDEQFWQQGNGLLPICAEVERDGVLV